MWADAGTEYPAQGQVYQLAEITGTDRGGVVLLTGYNVVVSARVLGLHANFLDADNHNFRLFYLQTGDVIDLGIRDYSLNYDGLLSRNGIVYHTINIRYFIPINEYNNVIDPIPPVPSEAVMIDTGKSYQT